MRRQRIQAPHAFPQFLLRLRTGERRDVPDGKQRKGKHARADEGMLPPACAKNAFDALFARPLFRVGNPPPFPRPLGVTPPRKPPAICVERLETLEAEET